MLRRRIVPLALVGIILVAAVGFAAAQKRMGHLDRLKEALGLTDAQVTQIQALQKANHDAAQPIWTQMRANHDALETALNAPEPNAADVGKIVIANHALQSQLRTLGEKLKTDIGALLTPDQKAKFDQLKSFGGRGRGERFHKR